MKVKLSDRKRPGFTLVEMLVVITIISILASLVLVGAAAARRAANRASIKTEIDQLSGSFQEYKQQNGSFPPNALVTSADIAGVNANQRQAQLLADLKRHFKQAFPKHQEPDAVFVALVGGGPNPLVDESGNPSGMSAAEAVYFWLGGFSEDKRYPISGKGGPAFDPDNGIEDLEGRQPLYGFDLARLGPRNAANGFDGRVINYQLNYNGQTQNRRIHLWTYAPRGYDETLQYFDTSRYKPAEYDPISGSGERKVVALKTLPASGATGSGNIALQVQFANADSFQILHAGIDDEWGDFTPLSIEAIENGNGILYPTGPFTGELADTQVNFSTETLESSQP